LSNPAHPEIIVEFLRAIAIVESVREVCSGRDCRSRWKRIGNCASIGWFAAMSCPVIINWRGTMLRCLTWPNLFATESCYVIYSIICLQDVSIQRTSASGRRCHRSANLRVALSTEDYRNSFSVVLVVFDIETLTLTLTENYRQQTRLFLLVCSFSVIFSVKDYIYRAHAWSICVQSVIYREQIARVPTSCKQRVAWVLVCSRCCY